MWLRFCVLTVLLILIPVIQGATVLPGVHLRIRLVLFHMFISVNKSHKEKLNPTMSMSSNTIIRKLGEANERKKEIVIHFLFLFARIFFSYFFICETRILSLIFFSLSGEHRWRFFVTVMPNSNVSKWLWLSLFTCFHGWEVCLSGFPYHSYWIWIKCDITLNML